MHGLLVGHFHLSVCVPTQNAFGVEAMPTSTATDHWFTIVGSSAFAVHPFPNLMYNTWLMAYNSGRKWGYAVCVNTVLEVTTQFLVVRAVVLDLPRGSVMLQRPQLIPHMHNHYLAAEHS